MNFLHLKILYQTITKHEISRQIQETSKIKKNNNNNNNQIFGHRNKNKKKPMIPYSSKLSTENPKHEIHSHPQSIY
jgi:hypothetical protein